MNNRSILLIAAAALFTAGCKNKSKTPEGVFVNITISPSAGYGVVAAKPIDTKISYPASYSPDSVVYFLDSVRIGSKEDSSALSIKTDTLHMGSRNITAKVYKGGKIQKVSTNFYVLPPQMPERLSYRVIRKFPHDMSASTQGLSYEDGYLYETTDDSLNADIRKVELETGKVVKTQKLGSKYLGRGNAIIGDKIVVFAGKDSVGLVFDKNTLKPLAKFNRSVGGQGWGATSDGKKLYFDDSSNRIWVLNKDNYHKIGFIDVFDHEASVQEINELEYIDGKIYANVYGYDTIVIIDAKTGAVLQAVNMAGIWPYKERPQKFDNEENVINGIAWDAKGKRLFVTGKKWAYVYQIEIVKGLPASITR